MLHPEEIAAATWVRFKSDAAGTLHELDKGGSGRRFYRTRIAGTPLVIAHYDHSREDNRHFVEIAHFLQEQGVPAARVLAHDEAACLIWMEDLGDDDLWAARDHPWPEKAAAYRLALQTISALHQIPLPLAERRGVLLQRAFDESLYQWEQDYFFTHCLADHFGWSERAIDRLRTLPAFGKMARDLAALPWVPVHRDFQSQNVMMRSGAAWLIDFQGMRPGLAAYDIASLLADPYVDLDETAQQTLLADYLSILPATAPAAAHFDEVYPLCAVQRLMQALGAYGNLGHRLGKSRYLAFIPVALRQLTRPLKRLEGFEPFADAVQALLADSERVGAESAI